MSRILTVEQAAAKLQISAKVVREYLRTGILPGRKVGKAWRVVESDLENWVSSGQTDRVHEVALHKYSPFERGDKKPRIELDMSKIKEFCKRWHITEFALFGSVLREDFKPDSDLDVLVTFAPDSKIGLFDLGRMDDELEEIVGRKVDVVQRSAVEQSRNYIRRNHKLSNSETIYVAR
jgi:uncharacterized protein